jgi:hypothetical protein
LDELVRRRPSGPGHRPHPPQLTRLIQESLDTIMRALVLDRENEQSLLRRGLVPVRSLPPAESARPHYVSQMYQRHTLS